MTDEAAVGGRRITEHPVFILLGFGSWAPGSLSSWSARRNRKREGGEISAVLLWIQNRDGLETSWGRKEEGKERVRKEGGGRETFMKGLLCT